MDPENDKKNDETYKKKICRWRKKWFTSCHLIFCVVLSVSLLSFYLSSLFLSCFRSILFFFVWVLLLCRYGWMKKMEETSCECLGQVVTTWLSFIGPFFKKKWILIVHTHTHTHSHTCTHKQTKLKPKKWKPLFLLLLPSSPSENGNFLVCFVFFWTFCFEKKITVLIGDVELENNAVELEKKSKKNWFE